MNLMWMEMKRSVVGLWLLRGHKEETVLVGVSGLSGSESCSCFHVEQT
jgi:hypothetical protein